MLRAPDLDGDWRRRGGGNAVGRGGDGGLMGDTVTARLATEEEAALDLAVAHAQLDPGESDLGLEIRDGHIEGEGTIDHDLVAVCGGVRVVRVAAQTDFGY